MEFDFLEPINTETLELFTVDFSAVGGKVVFIRKSNFSLRLISVIGVLENQAGKGTEVVDLSNS
jgi:hypothetical protein